LNFLSHIAISKILYKNLKNNNELDEAAFVYGNIKPDLSPRCLQNPHTLENFLITVCRNADDLINNEVSLKEYSLELGQICHYVCDFFCQYHLNEVIYHNFIDHFYYELKLHFVLMKITSQINIKLGINDVNKNISSIIMDLRKEYFAKPEAINKDIEFAFSAAVWICESVSYFSSHSTNTILENEVEPYPSLAIAGGQ